MGPYLFLVPLTGLEPARLAAPDFESDGSTIPPHEQILVAEEGLEPSRHKAQLFKSCVSTSSTIRPV